MTTPGGNRGHVRRGGFTLLEMQAVMFAMGVALFLGTQLIVAALKVERIGRAADTRLARRAELARDFRGDVARAAAAPDQLAGLSAGPTNLILRMSGGTTVVYRWQNGMLERVERTSEAEAVRPYPSGPELSRVEFRRPKEGRGLVTLRLIESAKGGQERVVDLSAALAGDLR